jgi:hypothetical protein
MILPGVDLFRGLQNTLSKFMIIANSWQGVLKSEHTTAACEVGYVPIQPCSIPGNCVLCFRTNKVLLQWKGNLDETLLQKCASKNSVLPELFSCSASDFFLSLECLHGTTIKRNKSELWNTTFECTLRVSMYFLIKMELIMVFECLLFVISALHTEVVQSCITCKELTKELRFQSEEPRWAPKFLPTWEFFLSLKCFPLPLRIFLVYIYFLCNIQIRQFFMLIWFFLP